MHRGVGPPGQRGQRTGFEPKHLVHAHQRADLRHAKQASRRPVDPGQHAVTVHACQPFHRGAQQGGHGLQPYHDVLA